MAGTMTPPRPSAMTRTYARLCALWDAARAHRREDAA
jgi:hypothetical protein